MRRPNLAAMSVMASLGILAPARELRAQTKAPPITDNAYAVGLFQGPILVPTRVMGIAGAYASLAEGIEGTYANSAAPAVREPQSVRWIDYDATIGLQLPGSFQGIDFENRGEGTDSVFRTTRFNDFITLNLGLQLQGGPWGASFASDFQFLTLQPAEGDRPSLVLTITRPRALVARSLMKGQVLVGGGLRAVRLSVSQTGGIFNRVVDVLGITAAAPEAGFILRPNGYPWRIGFTGRGEVTVSGTGAGSSTVTAGSAESAGSFILPDRLVLPWELEGGFALQLGPRPLNPEWLDPSEEEERVYHELQARRKARDELRQRLLTSQEDEDPHVLAELAATTGTDQLEDEAFRQEEKKRLLAIRKARYDNWPREKILLTFSALVTGPTPDAVSLIGFVDQRREYVGRSVSLSLRMGIEGEPVPHVLRGRVGSYVEPSRFPTGTPRQHFTFGADIRLFRFNVLDLLTDNPWRLSLGIDVAPRYWNWGIALGPWW